MNLLHSYHPSPILISLGPINIYWYGFFIILGIVAAFLVTLKLAGYYEIKKETIFDLVFYLIIFGIIGARAYEVLLELPYYLAHPLNIFKVWQGGLAIHGAIIAGIVVVWVFAKKLFSVVIPAEAGIQKSPSPLCTKEATKNSFWLLAAIIAPGLALAQAIGRWGNYFNQELFGRPTDLPWGIPIDILRRPAEYINVGYFHPTFLYESVGNLIIFIILICLHICLIKKNKFSAFPPKFVAPAKGWSASGGQLLTFAYLILYSLLRFFLEFIRVDQTPSFLGLRWPQVISLLIIAVSIVILLKNLKRRASINTVII